MLKEIFYPAKKNSGAQFKIQGISDLYRSVSIVKILGDQGGLDM